MSSPERLLTHEPQVAALWEKLRRFSFDRGTGPRTFAARLASEQRWSESFSALAIEEYRRFLLLFALDRTERSDRPGESSSVRVVPSAVVDEVWHLHLLYTQSYWEDLCRDILAGPLHHVPADGSGGEGPNLDAVYKETLAAYRRTFGRPAPASVWPGTEPSGNPLRAARPAGAGSARGSVGVALLIGGGLLVAAVLAFGQMIPVGFFVIAVFVAVFALGASGRRRPGRGKNRSDASVNTGDASWSGDASGGTGTDTHHDSGQHGGGSHDGGGHSHSCGGGHSCGGHGCGGGGCGGH